MSMSKVDRVLCAGQPIGTDVFVQGQLGKWRRGACSEFNKLTTALRPRCLHSAWTSLFCCLAPRFGHWIQHSLLCRTACART